MKLTSNFILYLVIVCCLYSVNCQNIEIKGVLKDSLNKYVSSASIVASLTGDDNNIIGYTTSKDDGSYDLKIRSDAKSDSIYLVYRHVSYITKRIKLKFKSQQRDIVFSLKKNQLDEVLVNAKKDLTVKGDTITYTVDGLKKVKDYTIEEVIDRIPGVTISNNGQIKYNNRAISHLYINGVDLLEGRYNIATRGIPADAVKDIEILKRHNHARIDKGVTPSNDVAFNLKIKKDRSLIFGSSKGDIGLPFVIGQAEVTPIIIKEKVQNIASLKTNNIGQSLAANGSSLTSPNQHITSNKLPNTNILQLPNTSGFGLTQKYWLDNESAAITNNALIKFKNDNLLKVIAGYNRNNNRIERNSNSIYFFDNDSTVVNSETVDNLDTKLYDANLIYEINKEKLFFKNTAALQGNKIDGFSNITQNENDINYSYLANQIKLSNSSEFKIKYGKKIFNSGFLIEYNKTDESNNVTPSVFNSQVPANFQPTNTSQSANTNQLNLGLFGEYKFDMFKTEWTLNQNLNYKNENLKSNLRQQNEIESTDLNFPFFSDFSLKTFMSNTTLSADFAWRKFKLSILPSLAFIDLSQKERLNTDLDRKDTYLFFQPKINASYRFSQSWSVGSDVGFETSVSRFNQLYNGLILQNFSNLYRNPNTVNLTKLFNANLFFNYRNILKGFFFNNATMYTNSVSDYTFSSNINPDGLIEVDAVLLDNTFTAFINSTSLTKRFFRILETTLTYTYNRTVTQQLFNMFLQNNTNTSHRVTLELELDNNTWYGFKYKGSFNEGSTKVSGFNNSNTFLKNNIEIDFYTSANTRLNFDLETVVNRFSNNNDSNSSSLFNVSFFYKPSKKLFLRAQLQNIFNQEFFNSNFNNANFISQSGFTLRPRQFTIGFNYTL